MKCANQRNIFLSLIVLVTQLNSCKAPPSPMEWTNFTSFTSLKRPPPYNEPTEIQAKIMSLEEIALNEISGTSQPTVNVNKPDEVLVGIKTASTAKIEKLNSEFKSNRNQWGLVCDNFFVFAEGECAKIARLTAAGKLKPNPALNIFARKLIAVLAYTYRVLAQFKLQRITADAVLEQIRFPSNIDPLDE